MNGTDPERIHLALAESDVVKLILDFLKKRELFITMVHLERETGLINGNFSQDLLFLRQLILNGQWANVLDFIEPLKQIDEFDEDRFRYVLFKYQYLELLCQKAETSAEKEAVAAKQIVKFLNDFRRYIPSDQEYKKFTYLLSLKRLQDHPDYRQWNPYSNRVQCFTEIFPFVHRYLPSNASTQTDPNPVRMAQDDRLINLLVKGLLYESSIEHCQARATKTAETLDLSDPQTLLHSTRLSDTDVSLLSWLHALPNDSFSSPFEQKTLAIHLDPLQKPPLQAHWTDHLLNASFQPDNLFPFNATPEQNLSKSVDVASRSSPTPSTQRRAPSGSATRSVSVDRLLPTVEEETNHGNGLLTAKQKGVAAIAQFFDQETTTIKPFIPLVSVQDKQPIRAVDIHPTGRYFAVGSNSKVLRICAYPTTDPLTSSLRNAKVLLEKGGHHNGSLYCLQWSPSGRLIATGSNDKLIKLFHFDPERVDSPANMKESELKHHNGTVRDLFFMKNEEGDDARLISAGGGDNQIYLADIKKQIAFQQFQGHEGHVFALYSWERNSFASASEDGTCRLWDIRQSGATHWIPARSTGSPAASVAVNSSGTCLAAGYEDAHCLLYDLRARRTLQIYAPHADQIRSVRFSPQSNLLLSASYDQQVVITDLSGDLTRPLVLFKVASHSNKIIQARWHPTQFSFATTSADQSCVVWASPNL